MTQKPKLQLLYFGHGLTGYYGIERLMRGTLKDQVEIKGVVISDRDLERAAMVRDQAELYGLEVYQGPLSSAELKELIDDWRPELGVVMNFDKKIPPEVIDAIPKGIWNIHPSDLPKYRGGLPLEYMVADGADFRISVHELTPNFDEGNIIMKTYPIRIWDMDIDELYHFSSRQSALALDDALQLYLSGSYSLNPQHIGIATYAPAAKLDELLRIRWSEDDGEQIFRKVLAGGLGRGALAGITIDGEERSFRIPQGRFIPGKPDEERFGNRYGRLKVEPDGSYSVDVIGGTFYFSEVLDRNYEKENDNTSQIITVLKRAQEEEIMLI